MKSSYLINLALIILMIGLYWFNNQNDDQNRPNSRLTTIKSNAVEHIVISQAKRSDIIVDKVNGLWQLSAPLSAQANAMRINLLLSLLSMNITRQQAVTQDQNLEQFGLGASSTRLSLGQAHFSFGKVEPISKHRYVLHNDVIYLLEDTISPLLNTNASSFIDNHLIAKGQRITQLTIPLYRDHLLTQHTAILQLIDGRWQTDPEFDPDQIVALLDHWQHASALQVIPLDSIASSFNSDAHQALVHLSQQEYPTALRLYLNDNGFFIINEKANLAYQFPKVLYQQLLLPLQSP